jgi:signal transduction histidine kinase
VLVNQSAEGLTVEVRDNGSGQASFGSGSGLTGLRERVAEQGGTLTLDSRLGRGTALRAVFPDGALPC